MRLSILPITMQLPNGTRLGPYEIRGLLGEGGMGEVYLARDSRLPRDVAIKRLKSDEGHGHDGPGRMEREAAVLARLTHPHICTLYDILQDGEQTYLVMERLQGETLEHRLARKPGRGLPVATALTIAAEVAEGLGFAHASSVTHQDVKPANILLTQSGAKLLDFGIARLRQGSDLTAVTATVDGLARAGTLPYMAPEQLDGRSDARSDIFSLGAVIFEMLTGHRAFDGHTASAIIGQIGNERRPTLPANEHSASLVRLVNKCLAIEPGSRWQSASDLADELRWIIKGADDVGPPAAPPVPPRRVSAGWIAVAALAVAGAAAWRFGPAATTTGHPPPPPLRADLSLPLDLRLTAKSPPALSHDGRFLAFAATHEGVQRLYVRDLQTGDLRSLSGTDNGRVPFWSPDGNSLAFFADLQLKRVPREGGVALTLAPAGQDPVGGDWNQDDLIVFAPSYTEGALWLIPAAGGLRQELTRADRSAEEQSLVWPRFLPGGQALLYVRDSGKAENDALMMRSLERDDATVIAGVAMPAAAAPGVLIYVRNNWLVSQPFDVERRALTGIAQPVAGPVETFADVLGAVFAAVSPERIVFRSAPGARSWQLEWRARDGRVLEELGRPEAGLLDVKLGVAGTRLVGHIDEGQTDLWLWDLTRVGKSRVTATTEWENASVLSADGTRAAFASDGNGLMDLYVSTTDGTDERQRLASAPDATLWPGDWSRDGRTIVGTGLHPETRQDVWSYSFDTNEVTWLFRTPAREGAPRLSPNGQWLAYQSDEAGDFDVYVADVKAPGARVRVSTSGGLQPRWRSDGRELFFVGSRGDVHAVPVEERDGRLVVGKATRLFDLPSFNAEAWWSRFDVAPGGQRFLTAREIVAPSVEGFSIVSNWQPPGRAASGAAVSPEPGR